MLKNSWKLSNLFFRKKLRLARILKKNPQRKGSIRHVRITTPRKPNSARRKTVKSLWKLNYAIITYIPGGSHQLKKFSNILIRGGGGRDLPGVYTSATRGVLDLSPPSYKTRRRSIYGLKKKY